MLWGEEKPFEHIVTGTHCVKVRHLLCIYIEIHCLLELMLSKKTECYDKDIVVRETGSQSGSQREKGGKKSDTSQR